MTARIPESFLTKFFIVAQNFLFSKNGKKKYQNLPENCPPTACKASSKEKEKKDKDKPFFSENIH